MKYREIKIDKKVKYIKMIKNGYPQRLNKIGIVIDIKEKHLPYPIYVLFDGENETVYCNQKELEGVD